MPKRCSLIRYAGSTCLSIAWRLVQMESMLPREAAKSRRSDRSPREEYGTDLGYRYGKGSRDAQRAQQRGHCGGVQPKWKTIRPPAARIRTVRIWNASTGQQLACLRGHSGTVLHVSLQFQWKPRVTSASEDGTVKTWETADKEAAALYRKEFSLQALRLARTGSVLP